MKVYIACQDANEEFHPFWVTGVFATKEAAMTFCDRDIDRMLADCRKYESLEIDPDYRSVTVGPWEENDGRGRLSWSKRGWTREASDKDYWHVYEADVWE